MLAILNVGIDSYKNGAIPRLRGCKNDALAVARFARKRWGNDAAIATLVGRCATRSAVLDQLDKIAAGVVRCTRFALFWSGHGSWLPTGGEADGRSEGLVAWDTAAGAGLILDWELGARLDLIASRGVQCMVALDSCFAGGMASDKNGLRSVAKSVTLYLPAVSPAIRFGRSAPYLLACAEHETAHENLNARPVRGMFFGALLPAWAARDAGACTWGELVGGLGVAGQSPTVGGDAGGAIW